MPSVTFQVLEGIDKGRTFRELPTPVTIGREEGNVLRLNDQRISRFHAKIQADSGEIILTDLESTNGTRVNGNVVQIRRLRPGDRVGVGRSLLLFGTPEEIAARHAGLLTAGTPTHGLISADDLPATVHAKTVPSAFEHDDDFDLSLTDKITFANGNLFAGARPLPPLPLKMTPSQAAPGGVARLPSSTVEQRHRKHSSQRRRHPSRPLVRRLAARAGRADGAGSLRSRRRRAGRS